MSAIVRRSIVKRSIIVAGHKTSISLEDAFWAEVKTLARKRGQTLSDFVSKVDEARQAGTNLSASLRGQVLAAYKAGELVATATAVNRMPTPPASPPPINAR